MVNHFFFDSYAIIELLLRNPAYKKYLEFPLVTTILNKIEIYWWAITRYNRGLADNLLSSIKHCEISDEVVRKAMLFRKQHSKRKFSYADAIGYAFAREHSLLFLTGDSQFRGLPGVQFVK